MKTAKEKNDNLKQIIKLQKKIIESYKTTENKTFESKFSNCLSDIFTKTQINLIIKSQKKSIKVDRKSYNQ